MSISSHVYNLQGYFWHVIIAVFSLVVRLAVKTLQFQFFNGFQLPQETCLRNIQSFLFSFHIT